MSRSPFNASTAAAAVLIDARIAKRQAANGHDSEEPPAYLDGISPLDADGAGLAKPAPWALPPAISVDEWNTASLTPRCIVAGYLWADVCELVAPGGTGKTTFTLHEAVCIALGRNIYDELVVETPGPVLYVTAEDQRPRLVARLREVCAAMDLTPDDKALVMHRVRIDDRTADLKRLAIIVGDIVTASSFADEIVAGCKAADFAPVLVQFDPLVSFGVGEGRVNDAEQALVFAARVIVAGLDCCVRYLHHTGQAKANEKASGQYAGRGGSTMPDGCRMVHVMHQMTAGEFVKETGRVLAGTEAGVVIHRPKLTFAPPNPPAIYVARDHYSVERVWPATPETAEKTAADAGKALASDADTLLEFIVAELQRGRRYAGRTGIEDVADTTGLSRNRLRPAFARLESEGRIVRHAQPKRGGGQAVIAPPGWPVETAT